MGEVVERIRSQLREALREHETTVVELKAQRARLDVELELHELLLRLGRNERLLDYFEKIEDDFSHVSKLERHGLSDEERQRLGLPDCVTFEIKPDPRGLADITVFVRHEAWLIEMTWHHRYGLIVRPVEGHRKATSASPSRPASVRTAERTQTLTGDAAG